MKFIGSARVLVFFGGIRKQTPKGKDCLSEHGAAPRYLMPATRKSLSRGVPHRDQSSAAKRIGDDVH